MRVLDLIPKRTRKRGYKLLQRMQLVPAGENLTILPDDVFIVSYPRSGTTYTCTMISCLLSGEKLVGRLLHQPDHLRVARDIYGMSDRQLLKQPRPRMLKSHEPADPRYPKVIYLLRDGRDVAVSYYYYMKKFDRYEKSFEAFLRAFVKGEIGSYQGWGNNVKSWLQCSDKLKNGFYRLKYEELRANTLRELSIIMDFLGCSKQTAEIEEIIEWCSIGKMQQREKEILNRDRRFKKSVQNIPAVRKGESGSWKGVFTQKDKELFKAAFGDVLIETGYEKDDAW